jgi:predicted glutamine amidotransferase
MHNNQISGYDDIRHDIDDLIVPAFYRRRLGATDREAFFPILLSNGLTENPKRRLKNLSPQWNPL